VRWRAVVVILAAGLMLLLTSGVARAHPLGNFTVNHYDGLLLRPDAVELTAVVDRAEIPTAQALRELDPDGDPDAGLLARRAAGECGDLADAVHLTVDGAGVDWDVRSSDAEVLPGVAGLPTLRLSCELEAGADLTAASTVSFRDDHLADRIGWREITADGSGIRLIDSPVPTESISDELRSYPDDLLSSPLDVRSLEVATEPGENTSGGAPVSVRSGDPFGTALAALDRRVQSLVGDRAITPVVGALAVLLAVLLGCGHALLPGHGKTVMAAYLTGRRGRPRDALVVGATVTATHTAGVLALGLAISLSSTLAGDQVLRWLGVASGALVAVIGVVLLRGALRADQAARPVVQYLPEPVLATAATRRVAGTAAELHEHAGHRHDHHGHAHDHHHDRDHGHHRSGLVGMGVAGGLVPSPSALVVLLASVGLGRTLFGVLLVFAYGLGMAGTLMLVGLGLMRLRDRLTARPRQLRWLARAVPVVTAALVLLLGLALAVRGVLLGP
jgi:ABC-type nickel/cobalt efflux system permease component RcnA